jgi:hypothetical protein
MRQPAFGSQSLAAIDVNQKVSADCRLPFLASYV